jgi:hypothetical protein
LTVDTFIARAFPHYALLPRIYVEDDLYAAVDNFFNLTRGTTLKVRWPLLEGRVAIIKYLPSLLSLILFQDIDHDGFKRCSPLRLFAPFLIDAPRAIYIDYDSVVLCNLEMLWDVFDTWTAEQWFGAARQNNEPMKCAVAIGL